MVNGVSAAESGASNNVQTATNEPGGCHQVRAGETRKLIEQLKAETVLQSLPLLVLHARSSC